jgi:UDP-N-acetylmuramoyl-tripeptide--D-alanyl-D-alanine ligase
MSITVRDLLAIDAMQTFNLDRLSDRYRADVSTDTRSVKAGDLFIAIRGETFDGHAFLEQAFTSGASLAVVDTRSEIARFRDRHPMIVVRNTVQALGQLARAHRRKFDLPVVAIAGSNGKTTTKELTASVLAKKYRVLKSEKNCNNHIGVPQTLFRLSAKHEVAVVEIGTNHFGELAHLCTVLEPTHGLITNIAREHLEFFGDLDGVAKAEGELFASLAERKGVGFVNADDRQIVAQSRILRRKVTYGFTARSAVVRGQYLGIDTRARATFEVKARGKRSFPIQCGIPGRHAMENALGAATIGQTFGVSTRNIQQAIKHVRALDKRMEVVRQRGVTILNDTYNANPDSVRAALATLHAMHARGKKIVILADMLELGPAAQQEHRQIGELVSAMGFPYLLTYGPLARTINAHANGIQKFHYEHKNELAEYALELIGPGDVVLVKGSRGMKMENVVVFLRTRLAAA